MAKVNGVLSGISKERRLLRRWKEKLCGMIHWERMFSMNPERYDVQLRKPRPPVLTYRFKARPEDEERRTYKLVEGKVEEYTKIERGWVPHDQTLAIDRDDLYPSVIGVCGHLCFVGFVAFGWFIREPLKRLYYQLDYHRIDLERTTEMEEVLAMETQVREVVSQEHSEADANRSAEDSTSEKEYKTYTPTPDFVHTRFGGNVKASAAERSRLPREWREAQARQESERALRHTTDTK